MLIIGLSGKAGSGKSTIADILVRDHGFVCLALADPIKRICKDIYDFSDEQLWGPSEKRNEPDFRYLRHNFMDENGDRVSDFLSPRYALQKLGTEWGRDCYPQTWIEYGLRMAKLILSGRGTYSAKKGFDFAIDGGGHYLRPAGVVISDVRFLNEVEGLRAGGAKLLRVKRPSQGLGGARGAHRSETEQDDIPDDLFDAVLNNNGSLDDLVVLTQGFLSKFLIEQRDAGFETMLKSIDDDDVHVSANETPAQARLRGMLEDRQRDVEAGKIIDYDASQVDTPPFKRRKKP